MANGLNVSKVTRVQSDPQQEPLLRSVPDAEGARGRQQGQRHWGHLAGVRYAIADWETGHLRNMVNVNHCLLTFIENIIMMIWSRKTLESKDPRVHRRRSESLPKYDNQGIGTYHHVSITNRFHFVDIKVFQYGVETRIEIVQEIHNLKSVISL